MFDQFGVAVQDLSAAISLLLPGFIFVRLFDLANRSTRRDRPDLQSVMLSLVISLCIYALVRPIYGVLNLPRQPLDPEFYVGLFLSALILGYFSGRLLGLDVARNLMLLSGILIPPRSWVQALSSNKWVVVHLTDGTVLYGSPLEYSDSPSDTNRVLFLAEPQILSDSPDGATYEPLSDALGILLETNRISFIEIVDS